MKKILLVVFLIRNKPIQVSSERRTKLSDAEIIQIATKAARIEGINLIYRSICFDVENKFWKEKLRTMDKDKARNYKFLENKKYQAVCLSLIEILNGRDVWVVIDKKTGEILALYKEE